jgi:hypothetical protein
MPACPSAVRFPWESKPSAPLQFATQRPRSSRFLARERRRKRGRARSELPGASLTENAVRPWCLELHTKRQWLRRNVALRDWPLTSRRARKSARRYHGLLSGSVAILHSMWPGGASRGAWNSSVTVRSRRLPTRPYPVPGGCPRALFNLGPLIHGSPPVPSLRRACGRSGLRAA